MPATSSGCCGCSIWWKTGWGNAAGYIDVAGRDWEMRSLRADDDEWDVGKLRTPKVSREGEAGREKDNAELRAIHAEQVQDVSDYVYGGGILTTPFLRGGQKIELGCC